MYKFLFLSIISSFLLLTACDKEAQPDDVIVIRNEGGDMPAYVYGNKDSKCFILLLHGGPGGSGLEYRSGSYVPPLEEEYAMVYWDQRGQGMAHGHYASSTVTVDLMIEDLHKLILALKHNYGQDISIFLMGHSWGGLLGTGYVVTNDYQNQLKGWIEVSGAHDYPKNDIELVKMFIEIGTEEINTGSSYSTEWQEIIDYAQGLDTNNISYNESVQLNQFAHKAEGYIAAVNEGDYSNSYTYQVDEFTSMLSGNITNQTLNDNGLNSATYTNDLYKITIPSLILWGKYDFVVPPSLGYEAMQLISSTEKELVIFENSGHSPMDTESEAFVTAVKTFVNKHK